MLRHAVTCKNLVTLKMCNSTKSTWSQTAIVCSASLAGGCIAFVAYALARVPGIGVAGFIVWSFAGSIAGFHLGFVRAFKQRETIHHSLPIESAKWRKMAVWLVMLVGSCTGCVAGTERWSSIGVISGGLLGAFVGGAISWFSFRALFKRLGTDDRSMDAESDIQNPKTDDHSGGDSLNGGPKRDALGYLGVSLAALCWVLLMGFLIGLELEVALTAGSWRFMFFLICVPGFAALTFLVNAMAIHRNIFGWGGTGLVAVIPAFVISSLFSVMIFGLSAM